MKYPLTAAVLLAVAQSPAQSQSPVQAQSPAQARADPILIDSEQAEAKEAAAYFSRGDVVDALPLYEHLAGLLPQNAFIAERYAFCLMSRFENLPPGPPKKAAFEQTRAAMEKARALGDHSAFLQVIIDRVKAGPDAGGNRNGTMATAEAAFAKGDFDAALAGYTSVAAQDPSSYEARLFAGDIYFRKHDAEHAAEWFEKAIGVDPNRETAYRYWGDALLNDGKYEEALPKFVDAVVAEPYQSRTWNGLAQWAGRAGATVSAPAIKLPKAPQPQNQADGKSGVAVSVDPESLKNPNSGAAWLTYSLTRALWRNEKFAKAYPQEKDYRHSLAEEVDALTATLTMLDSLKVADDALDPSLRALAQLRRDNLIEAFVLLNAADSGIARDYAAYRAEHREKLRDYVEHHLVHRSTGKP
jgi:tetratricopeptide (TPR) repeat protein